MVKKEAISIDPSCCQMKVCLRMHDYWDNLGKPVDGIKGTACLITALEIEWEFSSESVDSDIRYYSQDNLLKKILKILIYLWEICTPD